YRLYHQDLVLHDHVALSFGAQPSVTSVDPARLQRATQRAGESTGGSRDHVVEGGGVVGVLSGCGAVMLADLVVGTEHDGVGLDRQKGLPDRSPLTNDPHMRGVGRLVAHIPTMRFRVRPGYGQPAPAAGASTAKTWPVLGSSNMRAGPRHSVATMNSVRRS